MLGEYSDHRRVFVEVTKMRHHHGGPGWEFGTCLWSPERNRAGSDLYALMRDAIADDLVLHILEDNWEQGPVEHRWAGFSYADGSFVLRPDEPPNPGQWEGQAPFYRVPLRGYTPFPEALSLTAFLPLFDRELRQELRHHPSHYPFIFYDGERTVQLRQGGYINVCTPGLFAVVKTAVGDASLPPGTPPLPGPGPPADADKEYKETRRLAGERYAFARNPGLVKAAKALRGYGCEACDFDFEARYGQLGKHYVECHHVDPLGSRDEPRASTRVRDVRMVCANCHRMVHRQKPAMKVEALRAQLGLSPRPPIPGL